MAKSEKAKALEAKQKAELRAEKQRRKNSADPADWGRWRQMVETYKITAQHDKYLHVLTITGFVAPFTALLVLGFFLNATLVWGVLGVSVGALVAMLLFVWRARRAVYTRFAGQAGSGEVALQMLNKKWTSTPVMAATRQMDAIHRTIGPGGLILIGEGDPNRLRPLLASERKKHEQVAYGVEVTVIQMGEREGQVPLNQLTKHIEKLPKKLTPAKVVEVSARLRALDAMRPKAPIPKGPMTVKGARAAMRGR